MLIFSDCELFFFKILVNIFQQEWQPCIVNIEGTISRREKFFKKLQSWSYLNF